MMRHSLAAVLCGVLGLWLSGHSVDAASIPNAEFDAGDQSPAGWTLVEGNGRWVDRQMLEVGGDGKDSARWQSEAVALTPGTLYRFEVRARRISGNGVVTAGPEFANHDYSGLGEDWQWLGHVFRVPDGVESARLRVGQWHLDGVAQFDAVRLTPVMPVHLRIDGFTLGEREGVVDGCYRFEWKLTGPGGNYHRAVADATAGFNTSHWCFTSGSYVTYRFGLPGHSLLSGDVAFRINHHMSGKCALDVSRDQRQWHPLTTADETGETEARLPAEVLPANVLFVRLRADGEQPNFQIGQLRLSAKMSGPAPGDMAGGTCFADVEDAGRRLLVEDIAVEPKPGAGGGTILLTVKNPGSQAATATLEPSGAGASAEPTTAHMASGASQVFRVDLPGAKVGENDIRLKLVLDGQPTVALRVPFHVPEYYRTDYGERIESVEGDVPVWWCPATWKVAPRRVLPDAAAPAAVFAAARHDYQAVQVVVRPNRPLAGLTAKASTLRGPGGATIDAEHIKILRVYYHPVRLLTDETSVRDRWPDALPPLDEPIDVAAGENQPLWVLVYVPKDAVPGDYTGEVSLAAEGFRASVPLKLRVWDFTLPERNHLATAYGFRPDLAFEYHQVRTEADRRRVLDMYFQNFAEHRISPYDPVPLDDIRVEFLPEADPPQAKLDFTAFDAAMQRAVETHHFTTYRLPVNGMGGGTYHSRRDPNI
ncbi:MAG: hypothetical protein GX542_01870, partial [Rhodococcus sp.]|nr:hypothetical protein [Rhodococcus sp. (in: high G+C Gram-positive bacteria)]